MSLLHPPSLIRYRDLPVIAITFILYALFCDKLPGALQEIAALRLDHVDASLEELGALCDPPSGKSGVNSRFRLPKPSRHSIHTRKTRLLATVKSIIKCTVRVSWRAIPPRYSTSDRPKNVAGMYSSLLRRLRHAP